MSRGILPAVHPKILIGEHKKPWGSHQISPSVFFQAVEHVVEILAEVILDKGA